MADTLNVDNIITQLLAVKIPSDGDVLVPSSDVCKALCEKAQAIISKEPSLVDLTGPMQIVGDTRGCFMELLSIFQLGGLPSENNKYLFLGNYVDRGKNSLEVMCLLLAYKIKYPNHVFLLRGNHESEAITKVYGLFAECERRLNVQVYECLISLFNHLPLAAVVNNKLFCIHGGLSPDLDRLEQIQEVQRPLDVPLTGLVCDLLWSDPNTTNGWGPNERGAGHVFGPDITAAFLDKFNLSMMIRSHTYKNDGYAYEVDGKILTIFSHPIEKYATEANLAQIPTIKPFNPVVFAQLKSDGTVSVQTVQKA